MIIIIITKIKTKDIYILNSTLFQRPRWTKGFPRLTEHNNIFFMRKLLMCVRVLYIYKIFCSGKMCVKYIRWDDDDDDDDDIFLQREICFAKNSEFELNNKYIYTLPIQNIILYICLCSKVNIIYGCYSYDCNNISIYYCIYLYCILFIYVTCFICTLWFFFNKYNIQIQFYNELIKKIFNSYNVKFYLFIY